MDQANVASVLNKTFEKEKDLISNNNNNNNDDAVETNVQVEAFASFDDMSLRQELLRGIYSYGYEKPSAIQQRAIVPFAAGKDVVAQAQSGTGKTATYSVGLLQQVDVDNGAVQGLILVPTRELAGQVNGVVGALGIHMGIGTRTFTGGTRTDDDIRALRKGGVHVVTGTPGRVFDMISRGALDVNSIKVFVLDEADQMLAADFVEIIRDIFKLLPESVQVGIFSATLPPECLDMTSKFMNNPIHILVKTEELTLLGIHQFYVNVGREQYKYETLTDIYEEIHISQAVIFCNTRRRAEWLTEKMNRDNFTVSATHGALDPAERRKIMADFVKGSTRVLITTDLLARGIDVQQVSVVINFDLPRDKENYLHRIGRSGRFGRKGLAINLVSEDELRGLRELERFYDTAIDPMPKNIATYIG